MASPSSVIVLLAGFLIIAVHAGIIRRSIENLDTAEKLQVLENDPVQIHSALANHTAAVVELVLQNLHRLKNFQARERLERLVTRFKTLVDELDAQQIHNEISNHDPSKEIFQPITPSLDVNKNAIPPEIQQNEIPHSHRGQLSLTLLPKEQTKKAGNADFQMQGLNASEIIDSPRNAISPSVTVFQDRSMTTTVSTESGNGMATSESSQLALPKMNTEAFQFSASETKNDDGLEDDDQSEENEEEEDDDDELVSELHQGGLHEEHDATKRNDFYQPLREQDQLIEVNARKYEGPVNSASDPLAKENQQATSGSEEMEDDYIDDEESNKTETLQYPRQFDDDVKLLNKVIGNLRQVKEILQRMRATEGNSR